LSTPSAEEKVYLDEIQGIFKEISAFLKILGLYPPEHPAVNPAVDRAYGKMEAFLRSRGPLSFGVSEEEVILSGDEEKEYRLASEFARRLHQFNVITLQVDPGLTREEMILFGRLLSRPPGSTESVDSIDQALEEGGATHIVPTLIDYKKILEQSSDDAGGGEEDFWSSLVRKVQGGDAEALQEMSDSLRSPGGLQAMLSTVKAHLDTPSKGVVLGGYAKAFAEVQQKVFENLSVPQREEFSRGLVDLAVEKGEDDETLKALQKTFSHFPDEMVLEVLAGAVVKKGKIDNRFMSAFQGVLQDEEREKTLLEKAGRYGKAARKGLYSPEVWEQIRTFLLTGSETQFMSRDYHQGLEDLHSDNLSELRVVFDRETLSEIQASLSEERIAVRNREVLMDLIRVEERPDRLSGPLEELRRIFAEEARSGNWAPIFSALKEVLSPEEVPSSSKRKKIGDVLLQMDEESWFELVLRDIGHLEKEQYEFLKTTAQYHQKEQATLLVRLLGEEGSLSGRKRIASLLVHLGSEAQPALQAALKDERWFLVRNVIMVLGKIGDASCIDSLLPLLSHERFQVPREVLKTLSQIGGDRVVPVIRRILLNRSGQMEAGLQKAAAVALKRIGTPKAGKVLREGLMDKNKRVQQICTQVLKGLI